MAGGRPRELHGHTQLLGKLAVTLATPQPQLQHAALRLTARGWETGALPAPDGSGSLVVALDLRRSEVAVEHSSGDGEQIPLIPHRSVGAVTRDVLAAVGRLGGRVEINPAPQVLGDFRATFRGRCTPVNAWWGSFDLGVTLFSGEPVDPPAEDFITRNSADAQSVAVGWRPRWSSRSRTAT